ncbi:hypothetical protein Tco_0854951 [Tanacetum coccineum]
MDSERQQMSIADIANDHRELPLYQFHWSDIFGIAMLLQLSRLLFKSTWYRIVGSINSMHEKGLIPLSSMQRRVYNGASTKFWHDSWTGNSPFKIQFPRLFHLSLNKDYTVNECWNNGWHLEWSRNIINGTNAAQLATLQNTISGISLNDSEDVWDWTIDNTSFSVKSARHCIDIVLPGVVINPMDAQGNL